MWWPRLFRHHGEIAWDDYEKDYSDLPREVLMPHKVAEVKRDAVRLIEAADKDMRDILQVPAPAFHASLHNAEMMLMQVARWLH